MVCRRHRPWTGPSRPAPRSGRPPAYRVHETIRSDRTPDHPWLDARLRFTPHSIRCRIFSKIAWQFRRSLRHERTRLVAQPSIAQLLNLTSPPVAISFVDAAPGGVKHVGAADAAGCGYWRRAAEGEVFYTVADDHKRCPIGAHTHNVALSPAEKEELMGLVGVMAGLEYIKLEEVSQIPTRRAPFEVAVYAPL